MEKRKDNTDFIVFSLKDYLDLFGETSFKKLISDFSCPKDKDIVDFLNQKAVPLELGEYHSSKTYLVGFINDERKFYLCGYFTLNNKPFIISDEVSKNKMKQLTEGKTNLKAISAVLIGQLSKNYTNGLNSVISGTDLLMKALDTIKIVYKTIGVDLVYLECKDVDYLRKFYENNGFDLYRDKDGKPIYTGKDSKLLCYIAKFKNLKLME